MEALLQALHVPFYFVMVMAMAMAMAVAIKWSLPLDLERGRLLWDDNRFNRNKNGLPSARK